MGADLTTEDGILKQHYTDDRVHNMTISDNPLNGMMPGMTEFGGKNLPIPIIFGNPTGRSTSFARAQARSLQTAAKIGDFVLTRVKDYGIAVMDNETLEATKGNANAFLEAATVEIDGIINEVTRSLAIAQYRSGYGEIGAIAAGASVTGATLQLSNVADHTNFSVGQELDTAVGMTGASKAYGSSGKGLIITTIDRSNGILGFGFNVNDATNGIPTIAAGDTLFVSGDHNGSAITKLAGLEAWIPATAPSATLFYQQDRSVDTDRLGGLRLDGTLLPIEQALNAGASRVAEVGFKLDHFFMNYRKFTELEDSLGSKVQYIDMKVTAEVSFRGIQVNGPRGPIKVVPDQNCPSSRVFGLTLPNFKHYSLGKRVRVIDTDGLQMLRQASADGVECRYGYYANMGTGAPGSHINIQV